MANSIDTLDDIIQMEDITDRIDELREARDGLREEFDAIPENAGVDFDAWARNQISFDGDDADELTTLEALADELQGMGGDHQWDGDWYPGYLIRDSHFKDYAQELAEDVCSDSIASASWPLTCIDWDQAARELQMDYSSVKIEGITYWCR